MENKVAGSTVYSEKFVDATLIHRSFWFTELIINITLFYLTQNLGNQTMQQSHLYNNAS